MKIAQQEKAIQYRDFLFLKQPNATWLVRPIKSPMKLLPFRTAICSLSKVKGILDKKLCQEKEFLHSILTD